MALAHVTGLDTLLYLSIFWLAFQNVRDWQLYALVLFKCKEDDELLAYVDEVQLVCIGSLAYDI